MKFIKRVEWDDKKNAKLLAERGVGFEDIYAAIQNGHLCGIVSGKAPNYTHQLILVVYLNGYTYAVPLVEDQDKIFLKTLYPSRELHNKYKSGSSK